MEMLQKMPAPIAERVIEVDYFRVKWPIFEQWALHRFKKATEGISPDVILVHKPIDLYFIRTIFPKTRIVGVVHSFTAKHLEHADHIFVVSQALKNYIIQQGCKVPVSIITNAISIPDPTPPVGDHHILSIGTMAVFRRTKRLDLLIESLYKLNQMGVPFKGIIAGSGIQKPYLKYLIFRRGISNLIELRSWVHDKESFYKDIDIFCITSKSETFSISLIEAMARKKCVVSTACGGPNEIIEDQVDGILIPVGSKMALAENLAKLARKPELRKELGERGLKKVKMRYSSEVVQRKIADKLMQIVGQV
jgi:glycosyltransferase involved in cell wall biosynthesis